MAQKGLKLQTETARGAGKKVASCEGKMGYETVADANRVFKHSHHKGVVAYRCSYCRKIHIGRVSKRPSKKGE